jgi:hypothetical protein
VFRKTPHRCKPVWGFLLPWSARSGMSVSLQVRRFGRIPDHAQDALLRPLNDRCRNQQGNINGEMYIPKCIGNAKPKTLCMMLPSWTRSRSGRSTFYGQNGCPGCNKAIFFHGKDRG